MEPKPNINEFRIFSKGDGTCVIIVTLPKGYILRVRCETCVQEWKLYAATLEEHRQKFPNCRHRPVHPKYDCEHTYLNGSQIGTSLDNDGDLWICYFKINTTDNILEVLPRVSESIQWVRDHMVEYEE